MPPAQWLMMIENEFHSDSSGATTRWTLCPKDFQHQPFIAKWHFARNAMHGFSETPATKTEFLTVQRRSARMTFSSMTCERACLAAAAPIRFRLNLSAYFGGHERSLVARGAHAFGLMLTLGTSTGDAVSSDTRPRSRRLGECARTISTSVATTTEATTAVSASRLATIKACVIVARPPLGESRSRVEIFWFAASIRLRFGKSCACVYCHIQRRI